MTRKYRQDMQPRLYGNSPDPDSHIASEKNKARELRSTAWWRKKTSAGVCHYCGKKFKPAELTMDHIIPLSRGGMSERINLVAACRDCNNRKKYLLPVEWEDYMKSLSENKPDSAESRSGE